MATPTAGWILRIGPYANIAGRTAGLVGDLLHPQPHGPTEQRDGGQQLVGGLAAPARPGGRSEPAGRSPAPGPDGPSATVSYRTRPPFQSTTSAPQPGSRAGRISAGRRGSCTQSDRAAVRVRTMAIAPGAEQLPAKGPPRAAEGLTAVAAGRRSGGRGGQDLGEVEVDGLLELVVGAGAGVAV